MELLRILTPRALPPTTSTPFSLLETTRLPETMTFTEFETRMPELSLERM